LEPRAPASVGTAVAAAKPGLWHGVAEGWRWLRARPQLMLFLTCSLMPFMVVMVSNYLFPIYVAQTLHAGPKVFAGGEIAFALGAIAAGALLPRLLARASAATTIPGTMLVFLAGMVVLIVLRHPWIYLVAGVLLGFGNAGSRVARSALMLHTVPNEVMGRVGIFYNVLDRLVRTVLVGSMIVVDWWGPPAGFLLLFATMLAALAGVYVSRAAIHESSQPVPDAA
jgi:MFS family permease